jgi:hypothetical protein
VPAEEKVHRKRKGRGEQTVGQHGAVNEDLQNARGENEPCDPRRLRSGVLARKAHRRGDEHEGRAGRHGTQRELGRPEERVGAGKQPRQERRLLQVRNAVEHWHDVRAAPEHLARHLGVEALVVVEQAIRAQTEGQIEKRESGKRQTLHTLLLAKCAAYGLTGH